MQWFHPNKKFLNYIDTKLKNKKIIEIGAGNGYLTNLLVSKGIACLGVDYDPFRYTDYNPHVIQRLAEDFKYSKGWTIICCRPCNGIGLLENGPRKAYLDGANEFILITKPENSHYVDAIIESGWRYTRKDTNFNKGFGKEKEIIYEFQGRRTG